MATGEEALNTGGKISDAAGRVLVHDFRNLLAVIVNYCELIVQEVDDPEAVRADIAEVRSAADRALALTDRLSRSYTHDSEPPPGTP
jgi:two-component system cell cycle sensor histidine kinase/response regulator CckA